MAPDITLPWLQNAPIWAVGTALMIGLITAHEAGSWLARRLAHQGWDNDRSHVLTGSVTLLGLLMAFTFGTAEQRFEARQRMVVAEANALQTTYLRIQTLDEPSRGELSRQLLQYAAVRRDYFRAANTREGLSANADQTAAQQNMMWATVTQTVRNNTLPTLNAPLLDSVNQLFELSTARRAARDARVPVAIVRILATYALGAAAIGGFAVMKDRWYRIVAFAVAALLTLAFCLILDLDRPGAGSVQIDQSEIDRAVASIRQAEAAKLPAASPGGRKASP
jgi:hypothetical protein